jgi:hypothetical protein
VAVVEESPSLRDYLEAWTTGDGGWELTSPRDNETAFVRPCLAIATAWRHGDEGCESARRRRVREMTDGAREVFYYFPGFYRSVSCGPWRG